MKVSDNNTAVQLNSYLKQLRQQQAQPKDNQQQVAATPDKEGYKVELSDRAREVQQTSEALKSMPDVREDKVAQVKMEVDKGTYKVVGAQVATGMLRESFENNLILQKVNTRV